MATSTFQDAYPDAATAGETLIDLIEEAIVIVARDGTVCDWNEGATRIFGWSPDEAQGMPLAQLSKGDATDGIAHCSRLVFDGLARWSGDATFLRKAGDTGIAEVIVLPMRDGRVTLSMHDVTSVRLAAEKLSDSRTRLSAHMDHLLLAIVELDEHMRIIRWDGCAEQFFGWRAEEVLGRTVAEIGAVHPDDEQRVKAMFDELRSGRQSSNVCENRNLDRVGGVHHCLWHNSVLLGADDHVRSYLCLAQDVTDRVVAVENLQHSERLLDELIDTTNTGYCVVDDHGRIMEANQKYVELTGHRTLDEIYGRSVIEWTAPHDLERNAEEVAKCLQLGYTRNLEMDYVQPDGRILPVEINAKVTLENDTPRIMAFCRDITPRRRAQEERHLIERKLLETQKLESLGVLAGGIAHDFNNLLTGILGNASLAGSLVNSSSPVQPHLEQIETAAMRAADLCKQMLAYSGKGRFVVGKVNLGTVIHDTTELLRLSVSKRAQLQFSLAQNLPPVLADATQIRQVFMNLVINASEAIGERDGLIVISTGVMNADADYLAGSHAVQDIAPGRYVWMEVTDSGGGMSAEVQEKIFDPFFTTKFTGRGLGLAAVIGIVRGHKGALKVYSEPGKGTAFKILLPAADGEAGASLAGSGIRAVWRATGRVLVADDEDVVRLTVARMLESMGFQVTTVGNGREALEKYTTDMRAVLLDLTMPVMDGEETFRELRRLHPGVRVLLMSGFNEQEAIKQFVGKGLAGFLQKPFSVPQLIERLRAVLS